MTMRAAWARPRLRPVAHEGKFPPGEIGVSPPKSAGLFPFLLGTAMAKLELPIGLMGRIGGPEAGPTGPSATGIRAECEKKLLELVARKCDQT